MIAVIPNSFGCFAKLKGRVKILQMMFVQYSCLMPCHFAEFCQETQVSELCSLLTSKIFEGHLDPQLWLHLDYATLNSFSGCIPVLQAIHTYMVLHGIQDSGFIYSSRFE